jgi:hypothetical protein|tara:strand:- start:1685 stop:2332 length:648 start_codon:yes stop_codon:yes gene_type:complete
MTYLQLVNKVLIRLREDTVTSVNSDAYSLLIGEFVNDAIRQVEDSWDWSALRSTLIITTQDDVYNYTLTGSGNNSKVLSAINDTSNNFINYQTQIWFSKAFLISDINKGDPNSYTFDSTDANGDTRIKVYPVPNKAYSLHFDMVLRSDTVSTDTAIIKLPTSPIIHLAQAMAVRERGESGAQSTAELFFTADRTLSDAIALDAAKHPEETIFTVG